MLYVQIKAGLGNQMFEYAFGRAASIEQNKPLSLDTSWYQNAAKKDTPRLFLLDKFNIQAKIATDPELLKYNTPLRKLYRKVIRRFKYKRDYLYNPKEMRSTSSYFEGHWANEKYFKKYQDIIRNDLTLRNPLSPSANIVLENIKSQKDCIAVSVHVRRGDCVTNQHAASFQGTVDTSYYDNSYSYLIQKFGAEKLVFYIFSDDINWAKEHILKDKNSTYVSKPEIPDYEELHLMSICSHNIIANSSFSWWGAWLNQNPDKIVIAPKQWLKDTTFNTTDVCPPQWIRI